MNNFKLVRHSNLSHKDLAQIIKIKSRAWPYSFDKQTDWIKANLKDQDNHALLLNSNNDLIAYLNLIEIDVIFDNKPLQAWGIGNVCASEKGKGWGKEIMLKINFLLKEEEKPGLLFCKNPLIRFYKECEWKIIDPEKFQDPRLKSVYAMLYNYADFFNRMEFIGKLF